jgi:hypothetical protein
VIEDGKIRLDRLGPARDPPGLEKERQELQAVMPRADIPDVLFEIFARTGAVDCFTHISGATSRMDDLEVSVCAVLLAEAANRPHAGGQPGRQDADARAASARRRRIQAP